MYQKLKTPLSHLTNNMTYELDLRAIEDRAAVVILERKIDENWSKEDAQEDAMLLTLLVKDLADELLELNSRLKEPRDLCPRCAGRTWGRPSGDDYTRRQCHRCGEIRQEPENDAA